MSPRSRRRAVALAACSCASFVLMPGCDAVGPRFNVATVPTPAETLTVVGAPNVFRRASVQANSPASTGEDDGAQPTSWSSSDQRVALVNGNGMIVGRSTGTATVQAELAGRWASTTVKVVPVSDFPFRIIAHRGFMRRFPENTVPAVRASFDAGADGVEVDVRLSADGVPMIMHDETVDRTTDGHGSVNALTELELAALNACVRWPSTPPCPVPHMTEVLREAQGRGSVLLHLYGSYTTGDLEKLLAAVHDAGMDRDVVFICFDYSVLTAIRQLDPVIGLGYLSSRPPDPKVVDALGRMAPIVELQAALSDSTGTRAYLDAARQQQDEAAVWVAWNQLQAQQAAALGFRTIIADVPIDRSTLVP